jgi:hypothetical protein
METAPLLILLAAAVFMLLMLLSSTSSPDTKLNLLLQHQEAEIKDLRFAVESQMGFSNDGALQKTITEWVRAVHERDDLIISLQKAAAKDDRAIAKLHAMGNVAGAVGDDRVGSVGNVWVADVGAVVPTSPALLFDTSKCGIAWHSVIPDNTLPYFFPLPASPAPAPPPPSACVTHPELLAVRCYVNNLSIFPSRIDVAMGGEPLESVMGQIEDVEYAKYSPGAFASPDRGLLPSNHLSHGWYINKVLAGMVSQEPTQVCSQTPTLFITRYEVSPRRLLCAGEPRSRNQRFFARASPGTGTSASLRELAQEQEPAFLTASEPRNRNQRFLARASPGTGTGFSWRERAQEQEPAFLTASEPRNKNQRFFARASPGTGTSASLRERAQEQ